MVDNLSNTCPRENACGPKLLLFREGQAARGGDLATTKVGERPTATSVPGGSKGGLGEIIGSNSVYIAGTIRLWPMAPAMQTIQCSPLLGVGDGAVGSVPSFINLQWNNAACSNEELLEPGTGIPWPSSISDCRTRAVMPRQAPTMR